MFSRPSLSVLCLSLITLSSPLWISCESSSSPDGEGGSAMGGSAQGADPCSVIACSGHGVCVTLETGPTCACDEGYQADPTNGLGCLPATMTELWDMGSEVIDAGPSPLGGETSDQGVGGVEAGAEMGGEGGGSPQAGSGGEGGGLMGGACEPSPEQGCMEPLDSELSAGLCDGLDNDCDGQIDEGCVCKVGEVRPCFSGPVSTFNIGACSSGTMRCEGDGGSASWGACEGEIAPSAERCDWLDNDCDGCPDEALNCSPDLSCPGPDDPRITGARPFTPYLLDGPNFYSGDASQWLWTVEGGPCDALTTGTPSFTLSGATSPQATLTPLLSGSYRVTLRVTSMNGEVFECSWYVHVRAPGLRIEMCYPENTTQDLDLFMMRHSAQGAWFFDVFDPFTPNPSACSWANCEAQLRGFGYTRADWGHPLSPIEACVNGPQGQQWSAFVGGCGNPRLDIDNNLSEGIGLPENINLDTPTDGETYRVMVHNFSGALTHPLVNVYCGGELRASVGSPPAFQGSTIFSVGAMWRAVDITTLTNELGETSCEVTPLNPPGQQSGFDVTYDNPRF